jgi:hypothetical protein
MDRDRGQILYRFRPNQTFDHVGGFTAQVRQYGSDDAFQGPSVHCGYLIEEAMRLVRRWRAEGGQAAAEAGSDRAPEFPGEEPLAATHYEVVIPGKVFCRVWPRVVRCTNQSCGRVWDAPDPEAGQEWPGPCPSCRLTGARQLQYLFVHPCGEMLPMYPPRECSRCHRKAFRLDDRASRFRDFTWVCLSCGTGEDLHAFCPNRSGCNWPEKMMSPQVHTASSAYAGHGLTLVNPPLEEHAQRRSSQEFVVASIARWLGECDDEEAQKLVDQSGHAPDQEIIDAIDALETAGLTERAEALRSRYVPLGLDELRGRVTASLGFDPLDDPVRGPQLAANLDDFERVLRLPRLALEELEATESPARKALYQDYRPALLRAGFDPKGLFLVKEFPVTYLAVGHSRGGFGPHEADLVAYKGRAAKGQAVRTLIYAHPTETEALVFSLDPERVARWLILNGAATVEELDQPGGVPRWLAAHMDKYDGHLPPPWDPEHHPDRSDAEYGPRLLFTLLHSISHQMLRALAVDSGFSETALSEYLFPFSLAFAIHPNGGSEFTIGGLRTVLEQNLAEIVTRALDNDTCIYDPNCMLAERGADHGCLQLPETACQAWNWFISRWELFGSPDRSVIGYWSPELQVS